ncbi:RNA-directed DNA polymerase, eukaryota, reverse transcriptase zinc-binding domain protein [Tanacetum coccineum]
MSVEVRLVAGHSVRGPGLLKVAGGPIKGDTCGGHSALCSSYERRHLCQYRGRPIGRTISRRLVEGSMPINRGLIQAIPTSLPPQPIREATKASNLQRIPSGVQGRSHFTYFLYLIVQIRILQAKDDALRDWEAQIDQLRRQEHEVSECKMVNTPKNDAHQKETSQIERISSLPEKPNPRSLTIPCSVDIFNINAIAGLGANVNIMSESMLEELSLADPKKANIIVEMADKTRCFSQGIIENSLVNIDNFSFTSDFVIIDTKGLNNKTIILGQPFLAHIRAEINISTREVWLGIKEDRVKIKIKEQKCYLTTAISEHLNERPTSQDELSYGADSKTHCTNDDDHISLEWEGLSCTNWVRVRYGNVNDITKERILQKFWNNKFGGQTREKTITEEHADPDKCGETKARAIIKAMINKLSEEWFSGVSRDLDDLEGIINYLEPTLYDGFIDYNDEEYKQMRNKLLGIPYTEPPPIIKEEAKITKYNMGDGEVFTKTKILNIKGFPKTTPNIADIRWKEDTCTKWASCNPYFDECDGGDNPWENKEYWESSNDDMRTNLEWENLCFDNWVKVAFGKGIKSLREDGNNLNISAKFQISKQSSGSFLS